MTPETARASFTLANAEPKSALPDALPHFHTVPAPGRYPSKITMADGSEKRATVVIDDAAFDRILASFQAQAADPAFAGLLVDREHLSELPAGDSTAAAWVKTMHRRPDGLWTGWELTDLGNSLIPTKRFKFRSPVFDLEPIQGKPGEWRPVRLVSVALTNVPHFKTLAASLNRESGPDGSPDADPEGEAHMDLISRIRARIGKPDAQDDEVFAVLDAALTAGETAIQEVPKLQARAKALEDAERERQAEDFVKQHGDKVADAAKLKARFIADPEGTRETIALLKPQAPAAPVRLLGRDGETPQRDNALERSAARLKAVQQVQAKHRCSAARAWEMAQRDNPDLFV